jgi:hypothetical protein
MDLSNNHSEPVATSHAANGNSSDEVRDFLETIKCKDPDKVLGVEATRGLTRAMVQSAAVTVVAMIVFTAWPYFRGKLTAATKPAAPPAEKEVRTETPEPTKTPATTVATPAPTPPATSKTPPAADKGFLDKIGATDTKPANPKVNPLEKTTDDLFKDIDKK